MMAGNPNWWNMNPPSMIPPQYVHESSSIPSNSLRENPEQPQPWDQLHFIGLPEEERVRFSHFQSRDHNVDLIKQEGSQSVNFYSHDGHHNEEFLQDSGAGSCWSHMVQVSNNSPNLNVTTNLSSNNLLDFTYNKVDHRHNQLENHTSQCISTATAVSCKKVKGQPSSSHPPLKVRKEKLGDRVTALHQIVSPFGKTDTASVLLEAIGYIRFLQGQIEVMSDIGLKRKGAPNQDAKDKATDLKSRGLCLVPVSCTQHVGCENEADFWAPAYGSGF
ncbi:hypothetical protein TanjilG_20186 [Lupinus angustifolius]|uniref:BHLH domain-containing protein n=1 Tax=Lupinus angustifolius TaxID=3871 RepID=A0A1J7HW32_LUPAN|nr:hypothetical protein TanjilG_20186 [Lupinus angustifolius]